jgi:hypothetical protein
MEARLSDERRFKLGEAHKKLKEERALRDRFLKEYEEAM